MSDTTQIDVELVMQTIEKIRPYLQYDGGDITFVKVEDGYVYVKMYGACVGCMSIGETLNDGVGALLMDEVPGVKGVVLVDPYEDTNGFLPDPFENE